LPSVVGGPALWGCPPHRRQGGHSPKGTLLQSEPDCAWRGKCPPRPQPLRVVAIYRLSLKGISRSDGRDAVACAAYRAGERLISERTGHTHDYRRKSRGLARAALVGWAGSRSDLWNSAERAERRKNSQVAREVQLALPDELSTSARVAVSMDFARWLNARYGVAVDVCIHRPGRTGDKRNHHAHLLFTTRRCDGHQLTEKTRVLDDLRTRSEEVEKMRRQWAVQLNKALALAGSRARVDWRSHRRQGAQAESRHLSRAELPTSERESRRAENATQVRRPGRLPRPARAPRSAAKVAERITAQSQHATTDVEQRQRQRQTARTAPTARRGAVRR
jgi:hypothetical protein